MYRKGLLNRPIVQKHSIEQLEYSTPNKWKLYVLYKQDNNGSREHYGLYFFKTRQQARNALKSIKTPDLY